MAGRNPKYSKAYEMQEKFEQYFKSLMRPVLVWNKDLGANIVLKNSETGEPYMEQYKPATVTGLALAADLTRKGLLDYAAKDKEFSDTITRAKSRCEEYAESRLYDRDGARGAEFSLRCNFKWNDNSDDTLNNIKRIEALREIFRGVDNAVQSDPTKIFNEQTAPANDS